MCSQAAPGVLNFGRERFLAADYANYADGRAICRLVPRLVKIWRAHPRNSRNPRLKIFPHKTKNAGEHRRRFVQPRSFGPPSLPSHLLLFLAVDCCLCCAHGSPKPPPIHSTIYALVAFKKFTKRKNFSEKTEVRPRSGKELALSFTKGVQRMPNHKQRKKKDGANKSKKLKAMRAKEAAAKPAPKRSATGKPGQTSKFELPQDRPGAFRRA